MLSCIIGLGDSAEITAQFTSNWLDLRDAEKGDRVYASESVVDMDKGHRVRGQNTNPGGPIS